MNVIWEWIAYLFSPLLSGLAAYGGFGLALANTLYLFRKDRRRLKIEVYGPNSLMTNSATGLSETGNVILVTVANIGVRPVTIHAPNLQCENDFYITMPSHCVNREYSVQNVDFERELSEGQHCKVYYETAAVCLAAAECGFQDSVTVRPICCAVTGEVFKGKPITIKFDEPPPQSFENF